MPLVRKMRDDGASENKQEKLERWIGLARSDDREAALVELLDVMRDEPYHERRAALFLRPSTPLHRRSRG